MPRLSRLASSALALALLIVPLVAYLMVDDGRLARMGFSLHAPRWSLLLASPTMIQIHMAAAVMALAIGVVLLIGVKGNQLHRTLGWAWVLFFAGMGVLNLWVAFNFPTDTWVSFKMWGSLGLTLVFTLAQGVYLSRHMTEDVKDAA